MTLIRPWRSENRNDSFWACDDAKARFFEVNINTTNYMQCCDNNYTTQLPDHGFARKPIRGTWWGEEVDRRSLRGDDDRRSLRVLILTE